MRPCSRPGCPNLVRSGRCESCKRSQRLSDVAQPSPSSPIRPPDHLNKAFYNSKEWKLARAAYIRLHPICEICHRKPTREVHHKISIRERPDLKLDPSNFQGTCTPCHSRETVKNDGGFGRSTLHESNKRRE